MGYWLKHVPPALREWIAAAPLPGCGPAGRRHVAGLSALPPGPRPEPCAWPASPSPLADKKSPRAMLVGFFVRRRRQPDELIGRRPWVTMRRLRWFILQAP